MKKRTLKIGSYDTAANGWTLTGFKLSDPEQKTNYVDKTGGDGSWDLSTALTDGIPRYKNRSLTATLECSRGDREYREDLINKLVNQHDGFDRHIVPPDRPDHYVTGRVHIAVNYSDLAHAAVTITATVAPWIYRAQESIVELTATEEPQTVAIQNRGRLAAVPVLTVEGTVTLKCGVSTIQLTSGSYEWPTLLLTTGLHRLEYSGTGSITLTYREAVLR